MGIKRINLKFSQYWYLNKNELEIVIKYSRTGLRTHTSMNSHGKDAWQRHYIGVDLSNILTIRYVYFPRRILGLYLWAFLQLKFLKIGLLKLPVLGVCWIKNNTVLFMWTQLNSSMKFKIWAECKCHLEGFKTPNSSAFQETFLSARYIMSQEKSTLLMEVVLSCIKEFNIHSQAGHGRM